MGLLVLQHDGYEDSSVYHNCWFRPSSVPRANRILTSAAPKLQNVCVLVRKASLNEVRWRIFAVHLSSRVMENQAQHLEVHRPQVAQASPITFCASHQIFPTQRGLFACAMSMGVGTGQKMKRTFVAKGYICLEDALLRSPRLSLKRSNRPCLLYTSPSPRDKRQSRMPSSA